MIWRARASGVVLTMGFMLELSLQRKALDPAALDVRKSTSPACEPSAGSALAPMRGTTDIFATALAVALRRPSIRKRPVGLSRQKRREPVASYISRAVDARGVPLPSGRGCQSLRRGRDRAGWCCGHLHPETRGRRRRCSMTNVPVMNDNDEVSEAIDRLVAIASSDTGQSALVANFLLAWWDGPSWGHFPITDLFGLDRSVGADVARVFTFLAEQPGAIYPDAFGHRQSMADLVEAWREVSDGRLV